MYGFFKKSAQQLVDLNDDLRDKVPDGKTGCKKQHNKQVSKFLKSFVIHNFKSGIRPFSLYIGRSEGSRGKCSNKVIRLN